ncbi:hypothetical protein [Parapedobacter sp.]
MELTSKPPKGEKQIKVSHFSGYPENLFGALFLVNVVRLYQKHRFLRFSQRAYLGKIRISLEETGIYPGKIEMYIGKFSSCKSRIGIYHVEIETYLGRMEIYRGEIKTRLGRTENYRGKNEP